VKLHAGKLDGYALCHEEMVHTLKVVQTWGSLHNAAAATPRIGALLGEFGLKPLEDFRGRFKDRIDAYTWAMEHLLPECNPRIIGHNCTEGWYPHKSHKYLVSYRRRATRVAAVDEGGGLGEGD
jgi:hypothetical protein